MMSGELISAVVFGSVDHPVDQEIRIDFVGDNIVLFDKETTKKIGLGRLVVEG